MTELLHLAAPLAAESIGGLVKAFLADPLTWRGEAGIPNRLLEHIGYSLAALAIAAGIALPIGLAVGHTGRGRFVVVALSGMLRAVPTLGVLTLLALLAGLGLVPAYAALVILAVPPILAATATGVAGVEPLTVDAARAQGMTGSQVLWGVEVPLAAPVIGAGLRSALLQIVATVPIIAILPLGGLGRFVIDGLQQNDYAQVVVGAVVVALLALVLDLAAAGILKLIERRIRPVRQP
ncbi:ABC transporter permease [Falsarthrobacter nasiphocae]|uniref:Osmoprotectant transport system permease protein n=1 Tax=Falsarthrobacter nasiphocae TaxID=189863 RepID=A0AAE3YE72_9MICC|nr:ABC transporter permease subunit [Falsarthrobacter nasiphocae]MDR6891570.1 osmoprotectant transport system permease protein [Falsarthrobacter nasiphocae]